MAQPLIWSDASLDDIDGLAEYISRDSFYYAQHVVDEIMTAGIHFTNNLPGDASSLNCEILRSENCLSTVIDSFTS